MGMLRNWRQQLRLKSNRWWERLMEAQPFNDFIQCHTRACSAAQTAFLVVQNKRECKTNTLIVQLTAALLTNLASKPRALANWTWWSSCPRKWQNTAVAAAVLRPLPSVSLSRNLSASSHPAQSRMSAEDWTCLPCRLSSLVTLASSHSIKLLCVCVCVWERLCICVYMITCI